MKQKWGLPGFILLLTVGLAVLSFLLLPETVVIQFSAGSSGNTTAPRALAVLLPTALGIGGAIALVSAEDAQAKRKSLLVSAAGLVVFVIMLVVNTMM